MPFSPRRRLRCLLRGLRAMRPSSAAPDAAAAAEDDRRPWEPPFDASMPAPPISYPITDLATLASRSYLSAAANFHLPFNRASVPGPGEPLPARRRVLVCHDMQGGYRDDAEPQGGDNPAAYALWHWHLVDVFVYFSHCLVTLPPPCWTNAAHLHGVKVLGTFITEWDKGAEVCREMLATEASAQMYAERLTELAATLGFDGWLINIEVKLEVQFIDNLKEFVNHLTKTMHAAVPGSLVIWYDAITVNGELDWQNKLNKYNKPFFDFCDGLFANYTWKKNFPQDSVAVAGNRKYDIYMGIDVFGRNTFGGGQWTTNIALDLLKKVDVSTAIFAPGWVYETKQPPDFQSAQNRWWGHVEKSWGILRSYPKQLPFYSDFDQVSVEGLQVSSDPWNNISCQSFQPMLKYTGDQVQLQAFMDFMDEPYSGGYCLTIKGSVQQNIILSEQLFNGGLVMEDESIHLFYSVRADANSAVGLSLDLASRKKEGTSILVAEDITTFTRKIQNHKYGSYVKADKAEPHGPDNQDWVLYKATVQSSAGYTLAGINIVCTLKIVGKISPEPEDRISEANTDGSSPYRASLGHMSIRKTDANTEFPPAESWITKGEYISWSSSSNTSKLVSLKISWKLKTTDQPSFRKYNIYVENLTADSNVKASRSHLGVASVDAFYVSNLEVSSEVTSVKFIIQACAHDGSWQKLEECPKFFLIPVPSEL
ncbi:cytosolic endo-beta-N-acetylglucosaminidase 1-like isoform X3 [Phragmites australis]|uniref:cytosolic endo-beta-N-acetylglucosaminidase 1-like isoform X3 n=1 Tax=Phragmites australis TaxID=29695 RepID=UPI002D7955B7|nr:cytosolic endo-beta-N-acetylglucosaminidase 1-like isoform X3 [Phragmites australis]